MEGALLAQINSHTSAPSFSHRHGLLVVLLVLDLAEVKLVVHAVRCILGHRVDGGRLLAAIPCLHRLLLPELEAKLIRRLRSLRLWESVRDVPHWH